MDIHEPTRPSYDQLIRRAREISLLASCEELLSWDEETHMPPSGVANRGNQLALLAGIHHAKATDPRIGELLAELEGSGLTRDPLSPEAVNIRELRRRYMRRVKVPQALVEELVRTTSFAQHEWSVAYRESDFSRFEPWLAKVVGLKRREAEAIGYAAVPYDAVLDDYEPGATTREIARLFQALERDLVDLLRRISGASRRPRLGILRRDYPIDRQRVFGEAVAEGLGFDFQRGRLDVAIHPFFARIGPGDSRIATRYSADDFSPALFSILHEVGHALYEQGLDPAHHGTPMGEVPSLGLHESQSRLWENIVGRGRPFWTHFFPVACEVFGETLRNVSLDDFYFAVNEVTPSFVRAQADEVTYNLHVLMRFDIERALMAGDLEARDVPAAWNESSRRHLGIAPANDREGCLQDGHWGSGMFGYFPTYTLGNVFAAQLYAKAAADRSGLDAEMARGDFTGLLSWLRENVHRHGHCYTSARLIEHATGAPVSHKPLVEMLRTKYCELYGV